MGEIVVMDDTDAGVWYSTGWDLYYWPGEYNSTSHRTDQSGATATLIFSGSAIDVYGTIPDDSASAVVSQYTIDGVDMATTNVLPGGGIALRQLLFQSPNLEDGEHILVITCVSEGNGFWLDYFTITPSQSPPSLGPVTLVAPPPIAPSGNPTPATLTSTTTSTQSVFSERYTTIVSTANPSLPSYTMPMPSSNPGTAGLTGAGSPQIGKIMGGTVVGVFLLATMIFFFCFLHRRRRALYAMTTPLPFAQGSSYPQPSPQLPGAETHPYNRIDLEGGGALTTRERGPRQKVSVALKYVTRGGTTLEKLGYLPWAEATRSINVGMGARGSRSTDTSHVDTGSRGDVPPPYGR